MSAQDCHFQLVGPAQNGGWEYVCSQCQRPYQSRLDDVRRLHRRCTVAIVPEAWPPGPGTQLKGLLAGYGFAITDDCHCVEHAREMNRRGNQWCRANLDTIVGWLEEEARRRPLAKFVFSRLAARRLVLQAIRNAERSL